MAYNTNNPLGSNDFRDLSDNATNFDLYSSGPQPSYPNRFGQLKLSIEGMRQQFLSAQDGRDAQFQDFLINSGYQDIGDYGAGLTITARNQIFRRSGISYRVAGTTTIPYTTTGVWEDESSNFVVVGDNSLRQDLGLPTGAELIGTTQGPLNLLIPRLAQVVSTRAELLALTTPPTGAIYVSGKTTPGDPAAGYFLVDLTDTTSADDGGVTWTLGGPSDPRYKRIYQGSVDAGWFGAKYDGTTDDSAAVQLCVNYCLSFQRAKSMLISGRARLAASVKIDRLVDNTYSEFLIHGLGEGAGFYATTNVVMFDSNLAITTDPRSEWVTFKDLQFEASSVGLSVYVMSKAFLRIKNINCNYRLLRYCSSTIYMQTHHFLAVNIRNTPNPFIDTNGSYDIKLLLSVAENCNGFLRSISTATGTVGIIIADSVVEGVQTTFFTGTGIHGFQYRGIHSEGNFSPELNFWGGGLRNHSVMVEACYVINPAGPMVAHGPTDCALSVANYVENAFHSTVGQCTEFDSIGDFAGTLSDFPLSTKIGSHRSKTPAIFRSGVGVTVSPVLPGDMVLQFTSNTQATIKAMGSDSVVRSGNITLA